MVFNADGTYSTTSLFSEPRDDGTYKVSGNELTVIGNACPKVPGIYTWSFDGKVLKLNVVKDTCLDRGANVSQTPWAKQ